MNISTKTRYTNLIKTKNTTASELKAVNTKIDKINKRLVDLSKLKKSTEVKLNISFLKNERKTIKIEQKKHEKRMKLIEKAESLLENVRLSDIEKKNKFLVASNITTISNTVNSEYVFATHEIQLKRMQKAHPNCLYSQVVKFYKEDGTNYDDFYETTLTEFEILHNLTTRGEKIEEETFDFRTRRFQFINLSKNNIDSMLFKLIIGGSGGNWIVRDWLTVEPTGYVEITTSAYQKIPYIANFPREQIYKENTTNNCVLDGIISFLSNKTCKKGKSCYNKLMKLYDDYSGGVNEKQIVEICEKIKCSINIIDPIKGSNKLLSPSSFNYFKIDFYNTRFNHLDQISHTHNDSVELSIDEYNSMKKNSNYYIEAGGKLFTVDGTFQKCTNDFKNLIDEWREQHTINDKFINCDSEAYLMTGSYHFNVHSFFDNDMKFEDSLYKEIDAKKAYYNHSNININKNYRGVPSGAFINFKCINFTIDNFNESELIGFYQVKIIKIHQYIELTTRIFGFEINSIHTLTTSNIDVLKQFIDFEFMFASVSPVCHVQFNEKTLLNYDNKTGDICKKSKKSIRGYCKIFGILLRDAEEPQAVIKCLEDDEKYYQLINDENFEMYKEEDGLIKIFNNNKPRVSYRHIAYTIHGYLMSMMFEQMTKIDINMIVGVKLDSIVVKKECDLKFDNKIFDNKEANIKAMFEHAVLENPCMERFIIDGFFTPMKQQQNVELDFKKIFTPNSEYITKHVIIFGGVGGSGKTQCVLGNFDKKNICYATGSWNLINGKRNEFDGVIGLSIQKLIGENKNSTGQIEKCERIINKNIKVIVLDEVTMQDCETLLKVIALYPHALIFILGDITFDGYAYQCSINNDIINPSEFNEFQYIKFTKTYRFDEELNSKLEALREFQYNNKDKKNKNYLMTEYVKKNWSSCFKNKNDVIFNDDDFGISAINDFDKNENGLTKYFIDKGATPQYFIKITNLHKNWMRGQQLPEKPEHANFEMKLFKTVHAFQGLQCTLKNKIIISITSNFNYELYYTAFSRARRLDQIIILK